MVEVLGHPLPERTADSRRAFPSIDFFGAAPPQKLIVRLPILIGLLLILCHSHI